MSNVCRVCGKSFSHSGTLNRHYRKVHFIEPPRKTQDHGYHPYHLPQFAVYQPNYFEAPPPPSNPNDLVEYLGQQLAEIYPDLDLGQPTEVQPWIQPPDHQQSRTQPPDYQSGAQPAGYHHLPYHQDPFVYPSAPQQTYQHESAQPAYGEYPSHPPLSWHLPDDIDLTSGYQQAFDQAGPSGYQQAFDQAGPSGYQPPHPRKDRKNALQCHICDKYYSTRSSLIGHIRYVHNKEKRPLKSDSSSDDDDDTSYPESPSEIPNSPEI